jgi:hypothetical protein
MKKDGGGEPTGALAGDRPRLRQLRRVPAHLTAASVRVQGSGWGMLA